MKISGCSATLALIVLASSMMSTAQVQPAARDTLTRGAWALQFGIGSNFTLTSFQGSLIGVQYHYAECNAVRLSVSFNGQFTGSTGLRPDGKYRA